MGQQLDSSSRAPPMGLQLVQNDQFESTLWSLTHFS